MHIEIEHLDPFEGAGGHQFKRFPCIQILFSSPDFPEPNILEQLWALIDTGADHVFVDTEYMLSKGAAPVASRPVNSSMIGSIFNAKIAIPSFLDPSTIEVCGIDLSRDRLPYHVVLGRQFLASFRLEYDPQNGVHRIHPSRPAILRGGIVQSAHFPT